jgi:hypothetical protein
MPAISRFFGIVISMYYNDHAPPHFHAKYGEHSASLTIETLEIHEGYLPRRARLLVTEWAVQHREELRRDWRLAREGRPLEMVPPLE